MEYTGHVAPDGYDQVLIRGDLPARAFIAFWLRDQRLVAAMNVNIWDFTEPIQQLIRSGERLDAADLADLGVPLDELVTT
jgi:3-phenylpropionate/trans-cinnamate dioxygenase ferredoxin reductase subunit